MTRLARRPPQTSVLKGALKALLAHPAISKSYKTFLIAYLYFAVPRLLRTAYALYTKKLTLDQAVKHAKRVLTRTAASDRLPWFLARVIFSFHVATALLGQAPASRGVSTVFASYTSYKAYKSAVIARGPPQIAEKRLSNISSELTAMLLARALDSLVRTGNSKRRGDPLLFAGSAFVIMSAWFYWPARMQPRYQKWITDVAQMDSELVHALQLIRTKDLVYGVPGPHDSMLEDMTERIGLARDQGNTTKTVPIPCRLIHANSTGNCELHALWRFSRGFSTAMLIYVPLNLLLTLKRGQRLSLHALRHILQGAARSSAFLASFIFFCWYGVCLARTRLGPRLFPNATHQQIETLWGPLLGSALSGLSIFVESSRRHAELAIFVFSKAVDIVLPVNFGVRYKDLDTLLLTASLTALVAQTGGRNKKKVAGFFGQVLKMLF